MRVSLLALLLFPATPALAQHAHGAAEAPPLQPTSAARTPDERAVLAMIQSLFTAIEKKDRIGVLAAVVPEGTATAVRTEAGERRVMSWHWANYAEMVAASRGTWTEKLIDPHVHVERDFAMVWTRYELEVDGAFSHCGVDHFDLVRKDGQWRVLNLTWTNQKTGCPGR